MTTDNQKMAMTPCTRPHGGVRMMSSDNQEIGRLKTQLPTVGQRKLKIGHCETKRE